MENKKTKDKCCNCNVVLQNFMVTVDSKKYCRVCGDIYVFNGEYDHTITNCYECKALLDPLLDPLFNRRFDEHNNYYCKSCWNEDEDKPNKNNREQTK